MSMKEISFKDIRLTIGDRSFVFKQVPFRGNEANTLPAAKLAGIFAKRMAGSDSAGFLRAGDNERKVWEYLSQRTKTEIGVIEVPSVLSSTAEQVAVLSVELMGKIILNTQFQGRDRQFLIGLVKNEETIKLLDKIGIEASKYSIQEKTGVINGLSLEDLTQLVAAINARSTSSFSLPSHDFIKQVGAPIAPYLKMLGFSRVWLKEECGATGMGTIYDFNLRATLKAAAGSPDAWIGVILEVTQ